MPHIGETIRQELLQQERTVTWFARKLCCDRSNVYKLFKRTTVDTDLLLRVSAILGRNFFEVYNEMASGNIGNRSEDKKATPL